MPAALRLPGKEFVCTRVCVCIYIYMRVYLQMYIMESYTCIEVLNNINMILRCVLAKTALFLETAAVAELCILRRAFQWTGGSSSATCIDAARNTWL